MEEQKKLYTYKSNGNKKTVWCTRREFLVIKDSYDDDGLTEIEQEEYQKLKEEYNYPVK